MGATIQHITKTPGVCGGRACIAGHRIRVADIVVWHEMRGYCPDEIVDMFPGISLADVYAALAYYFDNLDEIKEDFRKADEAAEWIKANIPSKIPPELRGASRPSLLAIRNEPSSPSTLTTSPCTPFRRLACWHLLV